MTTNRRSILKGILSGAASIGFGAGALGAAQPAQAATPNNLRWDLQQFANTREATASELTTMSKVARTEALRAGYPQAVVHGAESRATMSLSPRGNAVGKCALILDDTSVFVVTKEFGHGKFDRVAVQTLWTDGSTVMKTIRPDAHAQLLTASGGETITDVSTAAYEACCDSSGQALGTCCDYDLQGMWECCGPCVWAIPTWPTFVACVALWCNYCNMSHCRQWYHSNC